MDDRVLMEAILPLLQALATSQDVRPVLHRRFDMRRWFLSQVRPRTDAASSLQSSISTYWPASCGACHWRLALFRMKPGVFLRQGDGLLGMQAYLAEVCAKATTPCTGNSW